MVMPRALKEVESEGSSFTLQIIKVGMVLPSYYAAAL